MAGPWEAYAATQPAKGPWEDYATPSVETPPAHEQNTTTLQDLGTDLKRGVQGLPGMVTGLADIPAGLVGLNRPFDRAANAVGEFTGFQPANWAKEAEQEYSPNRQAARADINQAWDEGGAGNIAGAYVRNPMATVGAVVESLPGLVVGGVAGKGLALAGKVAPVVAGALGEGAVTAGVQMDQTSRDVDAGRAALTSLAAGAGTAGVGVVAGKLASRVGLTDVETAMAGGKATVSAEKALPWYKRVPASMAQEGVLEEMPQSMQEQAWQNYAEGKPVGENVVRAGVEGALAGAVMGGAFNLRGQKQPVESGNPAPEIERQDVAQTDLLRLPNYAHPTMVSYPDGSVGRADEPTARSMLNTIEHQSRQRDVNTAVRNLLTGEDEYSADSFTVLNQTIPLPIDPGSAVAVIDQLQDTPIIEGTPEHAAIVEAGRILSAAGLTYPSPARTEELATALRESKTRKNTEALLDNSSAPEVAAAIVAEPKLTKKVAAVVHPKVMETVNKIVSAFTPTADEVAEATAVNILPVSAETRLAQQASAPAPATPAASVPSNVKLTKKQQPVFEHMAKAIQEGRTDEIVDAEGVLQYQKIADALGMARGSAKSFIDGTAKAIAKAQGVTVEQMKAALKAQSIAAKTTQVADQTVLGLSPAAQASVLNEGELFGEEAGVPQSMGVIDTIGGSQSDIGGSEEPPNYVDSVEPNAKARAEAEANRAAAEKENDAILALPEASTAALDWNDAKSDSTPTFADLDRATQAEFVLGYLEQLEANDSWAAIEAFQRSFEQTLEMPDERGLQNTAEVKASTEPALQLPANSAATGQENGRSETSQASDRQGASNPIERRVAGLKERLGAKQQRAVDKLIGRYQDGDIDLARLNAELDNYDDQIELGVNYSEADTPAERLSSAVTAWKQTVRDWLAGKLDRTTSPIVFETTPASLQALGLPNLPVRAQGSHFIEDSLFNHGVKASQLGEVVRDITDPVAVFVVQESNGGFSVNILTRQYAGGGQLVVGLKPVVGSRIGQSHIAATVFHRQANKLGTYAANGQMVYQGDTSAMPTELINGIAEAKKKYGQTAINLPALVAGKFGGNTGGLNPLEAARDSVARTAKIKYKSDLVKLIEDGAAQFSETPQQQGATAGKIAETLKKLFFSPERFDRLVRVVQSTSDLKGFAATQLSRASDPSKVQAFVGTDGQVVLIADNIQPGSELGVFLHEVGVHVGMEKLIGAANMEKLANQVETWATQDGTFESDIAKNAVRRAAKSSSTNRRQELIAYFIEEAVSAGVDPTAVEMMRSGGMKNWFRTLWAAAKAALHKLGLGRVDSLTAQNLIDLAYGAAKLEMTGTWHGTAANFRNFSHKYMGSGEGMQAFGWGTYLAQAPGIAHGYWKQDVGRKAVAPKYAVGDVVKGGLYDGFEVKAVQGSNVVVELFGKDITVSPAVKPEGSLMRVDTNVLDDEFLDWDKPLSEQSEAVKNALEEVFPEGIQAHRTGEDIYSLMVERARDYGEFEGADRRVSEYLDSIGVKGIRFLDANSRNTADLNLLKRTLADAQEELDATTDATRKADLQMEINDLEDEIRQASKQTRNLVIFNDKNVQRIMTEVGADQNRIQFSEAVQETAKRIAGRSGQMLVDDATHVLKKMAYSLASLHDLVDEFKGRIPAIKKWYEAVQDSLAARKRYEASAETIAAAADKLKNGTQRVNEFLSKSTFEQKWGYNPNFPDRTVTVDPKLAAEFARLSKEEQQIVRDVFAFGETTRNKMQDILKSLGIDQVFSTGAKLEGPYAPLKRFGNYVAVLKSADLVAAERADDKKRVEELKRSPEHYVVSNFDTLGQARQFAAANKSKFTLADAFEKSERVDENRQMKPEILQKVMAAIRADKDIHPKAQDAMRQIVQDMYFQTLDEQNARTSGLRRMNRAGYDSDMIRSFLSHARATAGFMANMEHGGRINEQFYAMQNGTKNDAGEREHQDAFNMIAAHYAENLRHVETPWQDRAMALTSAWQLATSVGYHVTNAMQGVMVTVPKLAADFNNYSGAWSHMMNGYRTLRQTGVWGNIDLNKVGDANLRAALQRAADMGVLDVGMEEDLTQFESTRSGIEAVDKSTQLAKRALHQLRRVSRAVETANRVASATAAYNMAIEARRSVADAQEYAVRILQTTQGDFSRAGAPLVLKKLPKFMTQYKKYQLMMGALYVKAFRDAFLNEDPEVKAVGRRMLGYKLFHASMAAGVLGLPLMNLAALAFAGLGGDDEPEDLERTLREKLGDGDLAQLLLHGPLAYVGLDMSSKLGEDKIFSILPYGDWDVSSAAGLSRTMMSLAGPAAAQGARFADGIGAVSRGDYYKGVEKFMPKGVESAMKAFRIANEGYTLKNGDVMFRPEDVNGFALALDALGMPSTELKRMEWLRSQQYEIEQFYTDRSRAIQRSYAEAYRDQDVDRVAELRDEWMELQDGKDHMRQWFGDSNTELRRQSLSSLLRYPRTVATREKKLQRAVE